MWNVIPITSAKTRVMILPGPYLVSLCMPVRSFPYENNTKTSGQVSQINHLNYITY
jgi:hypothetical protein